MPETTLIEAEVTTHRTTTHSAPETPDGSRRGVRGFTPRQLFDLIGALVAAAALTTLLFGWFLPLEGPIAWSVVCFIAFLGLYALMVSTDADRQ